MWKVVGKSPLPWPYVGVGIVLASLLVSLANARYSVAGARSAREVMERAARVGDYETARELFNVHQSQMYTNVHQSVLGAETEIENLVYPERAVENKILETEELLTQYPGHRDILVELARLYEKIGGAEQARTNWEQARILDPNNSIFAK